MKALTIAGLILALASSAAAHAQRAAVSPAKDAAQSGSTVSGSASRPVVLDRVIAIVNGQVLLQSDVEQERRLAALSPFSIPPDKDTDAAAARRLIRRTLMLEQMKQQAQPTTVSGSEAENGLKKLRATLHGCAPYTCASQQGWDKFLKEHDITQQEAIERWSQRLAIERFVYLRFRAGIHITAQEIATYYNDTLTPSLEANKVSVPPLKEVSPRIEELLLQQHVNAMITQWLQSLRAEGSVQILVPSYGKSTSPQTDSEE